MGSYVENNIREKRSHAMQQERGYFNDSVTHLCVCVCLSVLYHFITFYGPRFLTHDTIRVAILTCARKPT